MPDHAADTDEATEVVEEALDDYGPLAVDHLTSLLAPLLRIEGWRDADGAPLQGPSLLPALHPLPDAGVATADVPIAELGLGIGQRIGYVFDFGDDWRVRLTVRERIAAEAGDHPRVLELRGAPPPQYAAIDD